MNENDDYIIEIKNGKRKTYFKRDELREKGFDFVSKRKVWIKILCEKDALELEKYAKRNGFKVRFYPKSMKRSHAYREQYFAAHQPDILGRYFCTYCGKLIKPKDVQVDHMVSIALVQKNHWMQKYVSDINDSKNLVAACRRCNSKKGSKGGLWILRGIIGQYRIFWSMVYAGIIMSAILIILRF